VEEEECGLTQRGGGARAVVEHEVLALDRLGARRHGGLQTSEEPRPRHGVGIDDHHGVHRVGFGEEPVHRPAQRPSLAAQIGLVADHHLGPECPGDRSRAVRAVVGDHHDPGEPRRIVLGL
jgi:hypothetical protein